jgi:uncharacterized protein
MHRNLLILSLATMLPAVLAGAKVDVLNLPMPDQYVEDYANVINPEHKKALLGILQELEQKTGVQYIILTVETTGGMPIEDFSIMYAHNKWKLGQKDKDNGLLFTLAVKDRVYRFEVGYGLEGVITDAYAGRIGRDVLVPYIRKGQYSRGIYEANLRVIQRIAREMNVQLSGMPTLPPEPRGYTSPPLGQRGAPSRFVCPCCGFLILLFLLMVIFGGPGGRRGRGGWWWWFLLPFLFNQPRSYGRRRPYGPFGGGYGGFGGGMRGGFGGGGFGGGFGHFGGGGGGGFGGGGATGHW